MNYNKKSHLEKKSNWSYFYHQILNTDPRMKKKVIVGASMILIVVVTGVMLAATSLIKFSGNYIEGKIVDYKNAKIESEDAESI